MRYRYLMSGSPELKIDSSTEINIFFDTSGSMNGSLEPLRQARETLLANLLVPFYDNDMSQYNQRVSFIEIEDERPFQWAQAVGSSGDITKVINLLFTDENSPYDQLEILNETANADLIALRNVLGSTPTSEYYRMVHFAVEGTPAYQTGVTNVYAGTGPFTNVNLADYVEDEKVRLVTAVADGQSAQYYSAFIIDAINRLGYNLTNPYEHLLPNYAPVISDINSVYDLTFNIPITITASATDPEGEEITWSYAVTENNVTVEQADNTFTITAIGSENVAFPVTFSATDTYGNVTSVAATMNYTAPLPGWFVKPSNEIVVSAEVTTDVDSVIQDTSLAFYTGWYGKENFAMSEVTTDVDSVVEDASLAFYTGWYGKENFGTAEVNTDVDSVVEDDSLAYYTGWYGKENFATSEVTTDVDSAILSS